MKRIYISNNQIKERETQNIQNLLSAVEAAPYIVVGKYHSFRGNYYLYLKVTSETSVGLPILKWSCGLIIRFGGTFCIILLLRSA